MAFKAWVPLRPPPPREDAEEDGKLSEGDSDPEVAGLRRQRPLQQLTLGLLDFYASVNPEFRFMPSLPRRLLTRPAEGVSNDGLDNAEAELIMSVGDVLESDKGSKFEVIDLLGKGTFGQVVECQRVGSGDRVAVKVIKNKPAYFNQAVVETRVLKLLSSSKLPAEVQEPIVKLHEFFQFKGHLCLVFESLGPNLYEVIKQNSFRGLPCSLIRKFVKQILNGMLVLDDLDVIHCDLKPENLLLADVHSAKIKIIDFGSACFENQTFYSYIQSRFYRSPEVLLGLQYNSAIDMWSIGCIAAELFLGLPLFPGNSEHDQLARIIKMLGLPPQHMLEAGKSTTKFFNRHWSGAFRLKTTEEYAADNGKEVQPPKVYFRYDTLEELMFKYPYKSGISAGRREKERQQRAVLLHFLRGLLQQDPMERWTPMQAMAHPFITGEPFDERTLKLPVDPKREMKRRAARVPKTKPLDIAGGGGGGSAAAAAAAGAAAGGRHVAGGMHGYPYATASPHGSPMGYAVAPMGMGFMPGAAGGAAAGIAGGGAAIADGGYAGIAPFSSSSYGSPGMGSFSPHMHFSPPGMGMSPAGMSPAGMSPTGGWFYHTAHPPSMDSRPSAAMLPPPQHRHSFTTAAYMPPMWGYAPVAPGGMPMAMSAMHSGMPMHGSMPMHAGMPPGTAAASAAATAAPAYAAAAGGGGSGVGGRRRSGSGGAIEDARRWPARARTLSAPDAPSAGLPPLPPASSATSASAAASPSALASSPSGRGRAGSGSSGGGSGSALDSWDPFLETMDLSIDEDDAPTA